MKRIIISAIVFVFIALNCYPQARVDRSGTYKIVKFSQPMTNIVGWAFDETYGKWAGYKYMIDGNYKTGNNKVPIAASIEDMGENVDNILSLQFKYVKINEESFYVMYLTRWRHWYDYPRIYEGRHNYKATYVYFFSDEEYNKLFNLEEGITHVHYCYRDDYGADGRTLGTLYKNERQLYTAISSSGDTYSESRFNDKDYFAVKKENTKTIRFQYPSGDSSYSGDFSQRYFETSTLSWNALKIK